MTIAGANDMEPGFRAGYTATEVLAQRLPQRDAGAVRVHRLGRRLRLDGHQRRLQQRLDDARHVLPRRRRGADPHLNLPQIYNTTMAAAVEVHLADRRADGHPRINFGGALTEWTACEQAGSCGSLTGNSAWTTMWNQLQAEPKLKPTSLPYSTDLRIDS